MGRALLSVALLLLVGCGPKLEDSQVDGLRQLSGEVKSGSDGYVSVEIEVSGEQALLLTALPEAGYKAHVDGLIDPDGVEVYRADQEWGVPRSLSNGGYASEQPTFNWPILASDSLSDGRWQLRLGSVDASLAYIKNVHLDLNVLLKTDPSFSEGELDASVFFADGLDQDVAVTTAVDQAIERWRAVYAQAGVTLNVQTEVWDGGVLEAPGSGSGSDYVRLATLTPLRTVRIVVADEIPTWDNIYGISGDIPGPLIPTEKSGILVSALQAAGPDGRFSQLEIRILGETFAHEAMHYLGLFHPVESSWDAWDMLEDTPDCETEAVCVNDLASNLMFPFPVCGAFSCVAQSELTTAQQAVAQRYVGVR